MAHKPPFVVLVSSCAHLVSGHDSVAGSCSNSYFRSQNIPHIVYTKSIILLRS